MKKVLLGCFAGLTLILHGGATLNAQSDHQHLVRGSEYPAFTTDGAWCWFSDPRAVYHEGKHRRTYAAWISSVGDVEVGYYDHDSGDIRTHAIETDFQVDDHNNPSILIGTDGRLLVFYSEHSSEKPIYLQKTKHPEDITAWEERRGLDLNDSRKYEGYSDTYTYTNPYYLSSEDRLYLFWRGSDFKPNYAYSDDAGKTWSPGRILILPERKYSNRRPYLKASSNDKDRIHFAFTDGHPNREPTNSIYYMYYREGAFYRPDGSKIKNLDDGPVSPGEASKVYDATTSRERAWIWDITQDKQGNPVLVYAKFPDNETHIYSYARWDGSQWQNYDLVDSGRWFPRTREGREEREPNYSGGIVLDHEDPNTVYLSRQKEGVFEIELWRTPDGGSTWEQEVVTQNSERDNVRPFAVRNAAEGNPLQFLWMNNTRYIHYTDYESSIRMNPGRGSGQ